MKAALWYGKEKLRLEEVNAPSYKKNNIILKVKSCAICGSDLRTFFHGNDRITPPQILGHEISGEVVHVGNEITNFDIGDRLSIGADIPCGKCFFCNAGHPNNCENNLAIGYQYKGGFSEYIALDQKIINGGPLKKFSTHLSYEEAALAEPLACCLNGMEIGLMKTEHDVAILGAGSIGIMLTLLADLQGAKKIFVIDPQQKRLDSIKKLKKFRELYLLNPKKENIEDVVKSKTKNIGAQLVFTAAPVLATHLDAMKLVSKRGVINFFGGLPKNSPPLNIFSNFLHYNEIYLTGSHGSTPQQHSLALKMLESEEINLKKIITAKIPLEQIHSGFEKAINKEGIKIVINP